MPVISVQKAIGQGYNKIWFTNCHARYRVLPGARNTKKSHNVGGVEPIIKVVTHPFRNIIMCRQNDVDNGESTFSNLVQCIEDLYMTHLFSCTKSPYKITYKSTGQVIIFRGCNNPTSITSIKPITGAFTDVYFEEASELESYEDFRKIDGSIRGITPPGVDLQITFLLNPWDIDHWIHEVFCKDRQILDEHLLESQGWQYYEDPEFNLGYGKGLAIFTTSYKVNEFRTKEYDDGMEVLKKTSYDIYKTEGLGMWGNTQASCYPDWKDDLILDTFKINTLVVGEFAIGVDVGISDGQGRVLKQDGEVKSATTMSLVALTPDNDKLVVMDEFFHTNIGLKVPKSEPEIQHLMCQKIKSWYSRFKWLSVKRCRVIVDSASPGFMQTLRDMAHNHYGLFNCVFEPSTKIKIHNRINFTNYLMAFKEFLVGITCTNLIREIKQAHKGPKGEPRGGSDHMLDAVEYASTMLWGKLRRAKGYKFQDNEDKKLNI